MITNAVWSSLVFSSAVIPAAIPASHAYEEMSLAEGESLSGTVPLSRNDPMPLRELDCRDITVVSDTGRTRTPDSLPAWRRL